MNIVLYVRFKFRCIPELFRCDGEKDCEFNEDEETCGESLGYKFQVLFLYIHLLRTNFLIWFRVYLAALHKREKFCSYKGRRRSLRKYSTRTGNKSFIIYVKTAKWIIKIPISDFSKEILPYNMFFFFSVHDIAHNPPDLFVALSTIWSGRGSAFYPHWTERGWRAGEITLLPMTIMNWSLR